MPLSAKRKTRVEPPLLVVEISLGSAERDHDVTVEFLGRPVRLLRIGTDGDLRTAETLVRRWAPLADAVAVNGATEAAATGAIDIDPAVAIRQLMGAVTDGTVTDGRRLHEVLQEWSVRWVQNERPGYFSNARTDRARRRPRPHRGRAARVHRQHPPAARAPRRAGSPGGCRPGRWSAR